MLTKVAIGLAGLLAICLALVVWSLHQERRGYLVAVFAPDGQSIYALEREVSATVLGSRI